ncbi:hypothetical protein KK083_07515 [Fulvivirgaceae bacterium PWU4]|uniref:SprT-like domain-containing protein n=1 Tax=Chryseosolibacter histidini TaxID=2782349 RepID=A0AAP2DI36_9BACT|nr:hypothetical protein [Chryseosolibacter histidini]MBT1696716.1 hypothetical protein [Chryseosolibacter histidini]
MSWFSGRSFKKKKARITTGPVPPGVYFKALDRTILNKKNNSPGFTIRKLPAAEKQNPLSRTTGQVCIEQEYEYCYYTEACTNGECEVTDVTCETRYEWICWWEDEECYDECDSNCVNYTGDPCTCNNDCGGDDEPCYDECNPVCVNYNGGCSSQEPTDVLNHVVDPCLHALTQNLSDRSAFLHYMFGNSPDFDMEFADAPLPIGLNHDFANTGKQTGANGYFKIVTTLNSQSLPHASQEFITSTLIHEMYHTYMLLMDPAHSSNADSHDFMAQPDVIQEMAQMLRQMYPSLDVQTSIDLSWGGLEGTAAFGNLPAADRARINTTNNDHQRAAHGTPCP